MALKDKLKKIKVLVCDVDGVLTDGKIIYDSEGRETKNFHVQDGLGLVMMRKLGFKLAVISARPSKVATQRAKELRFDFAYIGVDSKIKAYEDLVKKLRVRDEAICFIGDDLPDLRVLKRAGLAVAVTNAVDDIKKAADYVTTKAGGEGAVREVIDLILKNQGLWDKVLQES